MKYYLGIDTSNYTTSAAAYFTDGTMFSEKKLLPVATGEKGLRQSDAVFLHTKQLPDVISRLYARLPKDAELAGVAASTRPRDAEGSYMPCFLVGRTLAHGIAKSHGVPFLELSHQAGHIAAALYGANRIDLLTGSFISFHISGGTTEGLLVKSEKGGFSVDIVSKTLDISAGQLIDRIGVRLGFGFPAGAEMDKLALAYGADASAKPVLKGEDCCLSGVENVCARLLDEGASPDSVAAYCLGYVAEMLVRVSERLREKFGEMPILFAGGVMSSEYIRRIVSDRVDNAIFTKPEFSSDNAAGTAYLAAALCALKGE